MCYCIHSTLHWLHVHNIIPVVHWLHVQFIYGGSTLVACPDYTGLYVQILLHWLHMQMIWTASPDDITCMSDTALVAKSRLYWFHVQVILVHWLYDHIILIAYRDYNLFSVYSDYRYIGCVFRAQFVGCMSRLYILVLHWLHIQIWFVCPDFTALASEAPTLYRLTLSNECLQEHEWLRQTSKEINFSCLKYPVAVLFMY